MHWIQPCQSGLLRPILATMRVCLCNDLSAQAVEGALGAGARRVAEVFRRNACAPVCGRCVEAIRDILNRAREEEEG